MTISCPLIYSLDCLLKQQTTLCTYGIDSDTNSVVDNIIMHMYAYLWTVHSAQYTLHTYDLSRRLNRITQWHKVCYITHVARLMSDKIKWMRTSTLKMNGKHVTIYEARIRRRIFTLVILQCHVTIVLFRILTGCKPFLTSLLRYTKFSALPFADWIG